MNLLDWLKGRIKFKPNQLKGAPGVSDPKAAADKINQAEADAIEQAEEVILAAALKKVSGR